MLAVCDGGSRGRPAHEASLTGLCRALLQGSGICLPCDDVTPGWSIHPLQNEYIVIYLMVKGLSARKATAGRPGADLRARCKAEERLEVSRIVKSDMRGVFMPGRESLPEARIVVMANRMVDVRAGSAEAKVVP